MRWWNVPWLINTSFCIQSLSNFFAAYKTQMIILVSPWTGSLMTRIEKLLPSFLCFYDKILHWGASVLGWGVPSDGTSTIWCWNTCLRGPTQKKKTDEHSTVRIQSVFCGAQTCVSTKKLRRELLCLGLFTVTTFFLEAIPSPPTSLCHFNCWNSCVYSALSAMHCRAAQKCLPWSIGSFRLKNYIYWFELLIFFLKPLNRPELLFALYLL